MWRILLAIAAVVAFGYGLSWLWKHRYEAFPSVFCPGPAATSIDDKSRKIPEPSDTPAACKNWRAE